MCFNIFYFFVDHFFLKSFTEFGTRLLSVFKVWIFGSEVCGILAPQPGIEPASLALEGSLNHWTAREVPLFSLLKY